jgi:hypothetical protein
MEVNLSNLKGLKSEEALELLHARLCTIESVMCETMIGFFDDLEAYTANVLEKTDLTRPQKDLLQAKLLTFRTKYKAKGAKK